MNNVIGGHLRRSWFEIPSLVDEFVHCVGKSAGCSRFELRDAICLDIGLSKHEELAHVSQIIGSIYEVLINVYNHVDVEHREFDYERMGLTAAAVRVWYEGGKEISALGKLDLKDVEEMQTLPWKAWSTWSQRDDPVFASLSTQNDSPTRVEARDKDAAYDLVSEFVQSCQGWRDDILASYTVVRKDTPVNVRAIAAAANLIVLANHGDTRIRQDAIESVLRQRGFSLAAVPETSEILRFLHEDYLPPNVSELPVWVVKRHKEIFNQLLVGEGIVKVGDVRNHFKWLPPGLVDTTVELGPSISEALAHLCDDAYLELSYDGLEEAMLGEDEIVEIHPFATAYVQRTEDIATALRCTGVGAESMRLISQEEALRKRVPEIAGWYAIAWID